MGLRLPIGATWSAYCEAYVPAISAGVPAVRPNASRAPTADGSGALTALVKSTTPIGVCSSWNEYRLRRGSCSSKSGGVTGAGAGAGAAGGAVDTAARVGTGGSGIVPVGVSSPANGLTVRGAGTPWKMSGSPTFSSDGNVAI